MKTEKTLLADFDDAPYPIVIGRGVVQQLPRMLSEKTNNKGVLIVADRFFNETLVTQLKEQLDGAGFKTLTHLMDAGKGNKNINEVMKIYGLLEEKNFPRDATLIALGGGVIGDLAGFVASTWLRGMNLVHIPSSLMSMVDSSVGGKVAINFRRTVNAVGNYYHPIINLIDLEFVESLSDRDYCSGIAEVIKCGIIADQQLFKFCQDNTDNILRREPQFVVEFIARALEIKIAHVQGDTREGGKRLLLNYGHTLGHSVEISTERNNQELYRHGEGVSIGIMAVAYIAEQYLGAPTHLYQDFEKLFQDYHLPTYVDTQQHDLNRDKLLQACAANVKKDKKRLDNALRLILADEIGHAAVHRDVPFHFIEQAFDHIIR